MASPTQTYPSITATAWWALRKKFRQSIPSQVTATYLSTVLKMKEVSARTNVLPGLKAIRLIDEDGKTTPRANRWRDDGTYKEVCKEIREQIYPQELRDAVPGPSVNVASAVSWFMTTTECGQSAAGKMAALYSLLTRADPSEGDTAATRKPRKVQRSSSGGKAPVKAAAKKKEPANQQQASGPNVGKIELPELRLNLEIRIDASVTPEQIDQIFASMAKYLYHRDDEGQ